MHYKQLTIIPKITKYSHHIDEITDKFLEYGALSVTVEDQFAGTNEEEEIFHEPGEEEIWKHFKILVLFDKKMDESSITKDVITQFGNILDFNISLTLIPEEDWIKNTQLQFEPIKITEDFFIVQSWNELPKNIKKFIIIDPGLAFGTGSHPTTFMCLNWLYQNISPNKTVLDYGCGSGILGIAAKKLGAQKVVGIDVDSQAIIASKHNANYNNTIVEFFLPDDIKKTLYSHFDIVVANILAKPLCSLRDTLINFLKPGASIILSGILLQQADALISYYSDCLVLKIKEIKDGWVLLEGKK